MAADGADRHLGLGAGRDEVGVVRGRHDKLAVIDFVQKVGDGVLGAGVIAEGLRRLDL